MRPLDQVSTRHKAALGAEVEADKGCLITHVRTPFLLVFELVAYLFLLLPLFSQEP
jgi:hypothetical protein